jgi:hypothetical protein
MVTPEIDRILEKLVRDVESAVHALYRGDVRQDTQRVRTGHLLQDARSALGAVLGPSTPTPGVRAATPAGPFAAIPSVPRTGVSTPKDTGVVSGWSTADRDAVVRCINAWLPMGGPASTAPDTRCIAAGKMLVPTWGEREIAREAVKKITQG